MLLVIGFCLASAGGASAACPVTGCPGGGGTTMWTLTITVKGSGVVKQGTTTRCSQTGLNTATTTCEIDYVEGTTVNLAATANGDSNFGGWTGACSGSGSCSVSMDTNQSVTATFTDSTPPPAPSISSPSPGQVIQSTTGGATSVSFTPAGDTVGTRCALDSVSFGSATSCSSPWGTGNLSTGSHTVYVWALDANGNASFTSRAFKVVNLPETTLGGTPAAGSLTSAKSTAFTYSTNTGTSYACTLDGNPVACSADLGPVGEGSHTLSVRAGVSPFGDGVVYYDPTPATRSWTVDSVAPSVSISSGPDAGTMTTARSATLAFSGSDPAPGTALTYACALDGGAAAPCVDSASYSNLAAGPHSFRVVATDAAGNTSAAAERSWTVIVDNDSDGFFTNADCDDSNAAIHPGAPEVPGNGVDEDCSGADASPPATTSTDTGGSTPTGGSPGTGTGSPSGTGSTPTGATPSTPAAKGCVVPKLIGKTLAQAKKLLAKAHCRVGKIAKKRAKAAKGKRKPKRGTVTAQRPKAGTKKPAGSKVALTLAK